MGCGGSCFFCGWGRRFRLRTPLLRGEETSLTRRRARAGGVGVCAASECPLPLSRRRGGWRWFFCFCTVYAVLCKVGSLLPPMSVVYSLTVLPCIPVFVLASSGLWLLSSAVGHVARCSQPHVEHAESMLSASCMRALPVGQSPGVSLALWT